MLNFNGGVVRGVGVQLVVGGAGVVLKLWYDVDVATHVCGRLVGGSVRGAPTTRVQKLKRWNTFLFEFVLVLCGYKAIYTFIQTKQAEGELAYIQDLKVNDNKDIFHLLDEIEVRYVW